MADALQVAEEAVAIRRELAGASPDHYRPGLAHSLTNLGIRLSEVGRPADALPVTEDAVAMYRELAAASPNLYRSDLARSLANPKLLGGGMSHKALTWAFASSAAKSSGYMADQRKRDHGIWSWSRIFCTKKPCPDQCSRRSG